MVFVADDLGAWLVAVLADAGRKKLAEFVLGTDQERALRQAAAAAVGLTARELRPGDHEQADQLALVISQVFAASRYRMSPWPVTTRCCKRCRRVSRSGSRSLMMPP